MHATETGSCTCQDLRATSMPSDDSRQSLFEEFQQLKIRYDQLKKMVDDWDHLPNRPLCAKWVFLSQKSNMRSYLRWLYNRAKIEGVDLGVVCPELAFTKFELHGMRNNEEQED
ncbi:hypothetical protein J6Z39_09100 [bacterium]|nr:hypothetical protein [bacterium]MBP5435960.1 hypothetical protein [bacterium]